MGFWQGLGRLIAGKPVFQDGSTTPTTAAAPATPTTPPLVDAHGYKIIPNIDLTHISSHLNGDTLTVTAWTTNASNQPIRIDTVEMLGGTQIIRRELAPSQAHELTLYQGPAPHDDHDTRALLRFCQLVDDDDFELVYYIKLHLESDGIYIVDELAPDGPPRDT